MSAATDQPNFEYEGNRFEYSPLYKQWHQVHENHNDLGTYNSYSVMSHDWEQVHSPQIHIAWHAWWARGNRDILEASLPRRSRMSVFVTAAFWKRTAERAFKTFAQTGLGMLTAELVLETGAWKEALIAVGVATVASVLSSIASTEVGDPEDPSLV